MFAYLITMNIITLSYCSLDIYYKYLMKKGLIEKEQQEELLAEPVKVDYMEELTLSQLEDQIRSSVELTDEEKLVLLNDDYISDVIDIVNDDEERRTDLFNQYSNLKIKYHPITNHNYSGYVTYGYPVIHMSDELIGKSKEDIDNTITHEYVHINQNSYKTLLNEATAEIISYEYFNAEEKSYYYEVKLTKMLMEMIGSEPVLNYIYLSDKSQILDIVRPYLDDYYYDLFNDYMFNTYKPDEEKIDRKKYYNILDVLSKLHKNMYGEYMVNNPIINAILNGDNYQRYYFNERYMDEEHSCYYTEEKEEMTLDEAIAKGIAHVITTLDSDYPTYSLNNGYAIYGDTVCCDRLIPQPVQPINKTFPRTRKKTN